MPLELIVGAAIGAAAATSSVRQTVRRGLVLGVSSVLIAYDRVAELAQSRSKAPAPATAGAAPVESPAVGTADVPKASAAADGKPAP
jgi:hypothetical protein